MDLFRRTYKVKSNAYSSWITKSLTIMMLILLSNNAFADIADPADPTTWTVTPSSYAYDMTMTAVLYFDLQESTDPNDRIAAFNENDCRGVEYTRTVVEGRYLAYLRIYGNNSSGDTITLYMYDSSKDQVVEVAEKVVFVPQANYGTQSSPYEATVTFDVNFSVETGGTPLSGATVTLNGYGTETTNGSGAAMFADVPPTADLNYSVEKDGYISQSALVTVDNTDVTEVVDLELETYTLSIEVTDGIIPLGDMSVEVGGYGTFNTNATGIVNVADVLPASGITISVTGTHFHQKNATIDVIDMDVITKVTVNPVTYSLDFNVTDLTGGVENTEVSLTTNTILAEDFADGQIPVPFHTSGNGAWQLYQDTAVVGDYAIRSAGIGDNQSSQITLTDDFGDGVVSFYAKVSSEESNDRLVFSIDGITKGSWSGDSPWQLNKFPVTAGSHTLQWSYIKDGSSGAGEDCAWLDYIAYTSADSVVTTAITNNAGETMISDIEPGRKLFISAKSDNHEYYHNEVVQLTSDSAFNISLASVYQIHFKITSEDHISVYNVENALITLPEHDSAKMTDQEGNVTFSRLPVGSVPFVITADKHEAYIDTLDIIDAHIDTTIEITLVDYETYSAEFQVIDGEVPVEGALINLDGYGDMLTDVYGKAVFNSVLSRIDVDFTITKEHFKTNSGTIGGLTSDVSGKYILSRKTYALDLTASDDNGGLENIDITATMNTISSEDFVETTIPQPFETNGSRAWEVSSDTSFIGDYSIQSSRITDNLTSVISLTEEFGEGYVSFYSKVSSEPENDWLVFKIDGVEKGRWSGETHWTHQKYPIEAGEHTLEWIYMKDGNNSMGSDRAWLDYISYTSADSTVQEVTSNSLGKALFTGFTPGRKVMLDARPDSHEYYHSEIPGLSSDSVFTMELAPVYNVNFTIKSENHLNRYDVAGALITLNELDSAKLTDEDGKVTFSRMAIGSIPFTVEAEAHESYSGTVEVVDADIEFTVALVLVDYETYSMEFEVIDGEIPVEGAIVNLEGYGDVLTNVYGKAVFDSVLSHIDMNYAISKTHYLGNSGTIEGLSADVSKKYILPKESYSLDLTASDDNGALENIDITATMNTISSEDFVETTIPQPFETNGSRAWEVSSDTSFIGDYSIQSSRITDNLTSVISLTEEFGEGYVSFYSKVSSEPENDWLVFKIDGVEKGRWSGETHWTHQKYPIEAGEHTLEWIYMKDGNNSMGSDRAWLDYISYTSADSTVQEVTSSSLGKALLTGFTPGRKVMLDARPDSHEYYHSEIPGLSSDSVFTMELAPLYQIHFKVTSEDHISAYNVENALITLPELDSAKITDQEGNVTFSRLPVGTVPFVISADKHETYIDTLEIVDAHIDTTIEITLVDYETYSLEFQVIDGEVPVEGAIVSLEGYDNVLTDVYGKAVFEGVLSQIDMDYTISKAHFKTNSGVINGLSSDVSEKYVLSGLTYELDLTVSDFNGVLNDIEILATMNEIAREDFVETTIPQPFESNGSRAWEVTDDTSYVGDYCIRSATITDNLTSVITLNEEFGDGYISFYNKVSSEPENDRLVFKIDGIEKDSWSGEVHWSYQQYPIEAGEHTLEWVYMKDGINSSGSDRAWLDYISYTSADSMVQEVTSNSTGEALLTGFTPGRKVMLDARPDNHEYYHAEISGLSSDSVFAMEFTPVYNVSFVVMSENHLNPYDVTGATITLNELDSVKVTDEEGRAGFSRMSIGSIPFTVEAEGHVSYSGTLEVVDADIETTVELVLVDYETYSLEFEVIDGNVPVSGISVTLEGYGEVYTNVYGKALFTDLLSRVDMEYEVSGIDYYTQSGTIDGLVDNSSKKVVLNAKSYNLIVNANDLDGPVQDMELSCIVNGPDNVEDFFSDELPSAFETYGNSKWDVTADTMLQGEYSVRTAQIFDNQETVLQLEEYMRGGYVSFYYKVSSEENNDVLLFEINGEEIARWSGEVPWSYFNMKIPSGIHSLEWKYVKDGNYSAGADAAWVDYVKTPSSDSIIQLVETDSDGTAMFYNVRPYNMVILDGYSVWHEEYVDSIPEIEHDTTLSILLTRVYDLDFNVTSDATSGGIAVRNAEVVIEPERTSLTDYDGYTTFERVSIGKVVYTISAEGYYELTDSVDIVDGLVTVEAVMEMIPEFKAANVITPNGDGYNDYWEIYNIANYASFTVSIYSAIGELLYSTTDYENNKWNGKAGERKLPNGIYYYIITSPYDDMVFEGVINLINK